MKLKIKSRSGREITILEVANDATVDDLQQLFHKQFPKFYPARQRFTLDSKDALTPGNTLDSYHLKDGDSIFFLKILECN